LPVRKKQVTGKILFFTLPQGGPPDMSNFLLRVECASSGPQGPSPPCPADPLRNAVPRPERNQRESTASGARTPQYGAVEAGRGQVKAMGDRWVTALSSMQQLCVTAAAIVSCSSPMLSVIDDGGRLLVLFIRGECSAAVASNLLPLKGVGKQQRQMSEARQHYRCNKEANDVFVLIPTHYSIAPSSRAICKLPLRR